MEGVRVRVFGIKESRTPLGTRAARLMRGGIPGVLFVDGQE